MAKIPALQKLTHMDMDMVSYGYGYGIICDGDKYISVSGVNSNEDKS